jgi:hypothetical protein
LASVLVTMLSLVSAPAVSAASEFPAGYEGYHSYGEVDTFLDNVVAEYGQGGGAIVKRSVIGQSFEGRNIWALKISDNVDTDENEPEVLAECGMHAREVLTVEMCLYMISLLTDNYGQATSLGERVTPIVDSREIWVIANLNPDGSEFQIHDGTFHNWRKNRQVNPGSPYIGIDLNRNWSYKWACCGGSSGNPRSARYRGQYPFEAPEDAALRDFMLGRRANGEQQLKVVLNWHSYGEHVLWPYGYTKEDVPSDMTADDHLAMKTLAKKMASINGYTAMQGSNMYIYDGDFIDWAYGDQHIFPFTFEMYPPWGCKGCGKFHPPDEVIGRETRRNKNAVLYILEQADCPYREAGLEGKYCS